MSGSAQRPPVVELAAAEVRARTPLVSVLINTYNHEAFIGACLDGALAQQTDFPVEWVVGEDGSADRTREICRAYQRRYPAQIRLLLPERNLGELENFRVCFEACRGRYIALLEGDDLWLSPHKLQRQVDALERHPEWALCIHNVKLIGERQTAEDVFFTGPPRAVYRRADFVERDFVPTCSCVLRNLGLAILPEWFWDRELNPYPDWILYVSQAAYGDVGYLDKVLGAHRRHAGGVWGSTFDGSVEGDIRRMRKRLTAFERLGECLGPEYAAAVRRQRAAACFHLALAYREGGDRRQQRRFLIRGWLTEPRAPYPFWRCYLRSWRR